MDSIQLDSVPFAVESQFGNVTFELLPPDEAITLDEDFDFLAAQEHRDLARTVTVHNKCTSQAFWLAIIYYSSTENR